MRRRDEFGVTAVSLATRVRTTRITLGLFDYHAPPLLNYIMVYGLNTMWLKFLQCYVIMIEQAVKSIYVGFPN